MKKKVFSDGEISIWIEQDSSIHIKAYTNDYKDPVELSPDEAREIGEELIRMADILDSEKTN